MNKTIFKVTKLHEVDSTNKYARNLIEKKMAFHGDAIIASYQTQGKGMDNHTWDSDRDKNILLSIILFPKNLLIVNQFNISMMVGLAIKDFLLQLNINALVKWPNDILVNKKKIAGILIENVWEGELVKNCIVGIGLNVNQTMFSSSLENVTSIAIETKMNYHLDFCLEKLLNCISDRYKVLDNNNWDNLTDEYLQCLYLYGKESLFSSRGNTFEARIIGIGNHGELKVQMTSGEIQYFQFKEIEFL